MLTFSNASPPLSFDLIPAKTLAYCVLEIQGGNEMGVTTSTKEGSDAKYLSVKLTVTEGPFVKRCFFSRIGVAGSEAYVNMGRTAIRAILENNGASSSNPGRYSISSYRELSGMRVAVQIKIESSAGFEDKNDVGVWLSPNPEFGTKKKYDQLVDMARGGYKNVAGNFNKAEPVVSAMVFDEDIPF